MKTKSMIFQHIVEITLKMVLLYINKNNQESNFSSIVKNVQKTMNIELLNDLFLELLFLREIIRVAIKEFISLDDDIVHQVHPSRLTTYY